MKGRGEKGEKGKCKHGSRSFLFRLKHAHFNASQLQQIEFGFLKTCMSQFLFPA